MRTMSFQRIIFACSLMSIIQLFYHAPVFSKDDRDISKPTSVLFNLTENINRDLVNENGKDLQQYIHPDLGLTLSISQVIDWEPDEDDKKRSVTLSYDEVSGMFNSEKTYSWDYPGQTIAWQYDMNIKKFVKEFITKRSQGYLVDSISAKYSYHVTHPFEKDFPVIAGNKEWEERLSKAFIVEKDYSFPDFHLMDFNGRKIFFVYELVDENYYLTAVANQIYLLDIAFAFRWEFYNWPEDMCATRGKGKKFKYSPLQAKNTIMNKATKALYCLHFQKFEELSEMVDPDNGLRLASVPEISEDNIILDKKSIQEIMSDTKSYDFGLWRDNIVMIKNNEGEYERRDSGTLREYYENVLYPVNYLNTPFVYYNSLMHSSSYIEYNDNYTDPDMITVEYYMPRCASSWQWSDLTMIFIKRDDNWYLSAFVSNRYSAGESGK